MLQTQEHKINLIKKLSFEYFRQEMFVFSYIFVSVNTFIVGSGILRLRKPIYEFYLWEDFFNVFWSPKIPALTVTAITIITIKIYTNVLLSRTDQRDVFFWWQTKTDDGTTRDTCTVWRTMERLISAAKMFSTVARLNKNSRFYCVTNVEIG